MHQQFILFKKTLNIFHNFIPNKIIIGDVRDVFRMNDEIKAIIKKNNWLHQRQKKCGNLESFVSGAKFP